MVLLFHFFSRWTKVYPYAADYDFFSFGKLGVQLFFMISGFVILNSLEKTSSILVFIKKRIIRLFPSMLIASIITYLFLIAFDSKNLFPSGHYFKNLLVSLTFIEPDLLSSLFQRKINFDYLSSVYWSLWPEIQFYFFVSFIFFSFRKNFYLYFFSIALIISLFKIVLMQVTVGQDSFLFEIKNLFRVFNLTYTLPFFCFGVYFYLLYNSRKIGLKTTIDKHLFFVSFIVIQIYYFSEQPLKLVFLLVFVLMFYGLLFYENKLLWFQSQYLIKLGVSSYFLYLIHESIGVVLIDKFASNGFPYFTIILILVLCYLSYKFTYLIDIKLAKFLKNKTLKP